MRVLISGDIGWVRWPPIREVARLFTRADMLVLDPTQGPGAFMDWFLNKSGEIKYARRAIVEPFTAEWPKFARDLARQKRNERMLVAGRPEAVVYFHDTPIGDEEMDHLFELAAGLEIPIFDWIDFVEHRKGVE